MKPSLFVRTFFGYAAVIILLAAAVALSAPGPMRKHFIQVEAAGLERLGVLLEDRVLPSLSGAGKDGLEEYVLAMGKKTSTRITVIDPEGRVLADSEKEPRDMENHLYRPEIFEALQGRKQMSVRRSSTLNRDMMYMSLPLVSNGKVAGVLRLSLFMKDLDLLFDRLRGDLLRTLGLAALLALILAFIFSRSIARPIRQFVEASARVAAGDFEVKVSTRQKAREFKTLAKSFNTMTSELQDLFLESKAKTEKLDSILASIREGLCVLDGEERIVLSNESFRRIVGNEKPEGKAYWEVVRNSKFAEIIKRAGAARAGVTDELSLADRVYICNVSTLVSRERYVVTLHDMTEFKNLEKIKKDFVVNVSHELKTPLAAIKGFVETMESSSAGPENRSYLEIVKRNTDRLIAIVGDLLVLSELEEKGSRLAKEKTDLRTAAGNIIRIFEKQAREKGLTLLLEAGRDLPLVMADPYEIERLILNLVDNAIKYTDKGGVTVRLAAGEDRFTIEVADTGIGIDADHLPHIFERFYVVDKSRSRKSGGTGLGLSIAKHIVLAHQGTIAVKSRIGEGTTFTVSLPGS
jgi:two-component system phosphate regulon sensor histidine kinase PhoR